jgi:hypothetical protein
MPTDFAMSMKWSILLTFHTILDLILWCRPKRILKIMQSQETYGRGFIHKPGNFSYYAPGYLP